VADAKYNGVPGPTLMRCSVVKGYTTPESGFFPFVSGSVSWRRGHLATCADLISVGWCISHVAAPHTYCGSLAVQATSAETDACVLCDLETSPCPRTVLCQRQDQR
jgi:hypothetical protein